MDSFIDQSGFTTLEYTLVLFGFLAMIVALGALWKYSKDGLLLLSAKESASHLFDTSANFISGLQDVLLY